MRIVVTALMAAAWTAWTATEVAAQPAPASPPTRDAIIAAARTVAGKARYATFITLDGRGQPQARIVDPFALEDDLTVWVGTKAGSRKAAQIAYDRRVTLLYFDAAGQNYVTLIGSAQVVRDPKEKAQRWKDEWTPFYEDRNRGEDYVLIRFRPTRIEVVAPALGMTNDPTTWRPVVLDLR